jgi:HrpA-like RNA helicase
MTDGTLLRQDPHFDLYDIVIVDEAHERSLETDILFGLLRAATRRNNKLKVVIMSATLDIDQFTNFFDSCPAFSVPGRTYEVDVLWQKSITFATLKNTYLQRSIETTLHIHKTESPGDVLVFLTGRAEIERAIKQLKEADADLDYACLQNGVNGMRVCGIYSSLETLEQRVIFEPSPPGIRKIIIATNIAQTSITVPGIRYVVDSGFVKEKQYDPKTGMDALLVSPISQAASTQRAGRAGRTENGKVYRLYCKQAFQEMTDTTVPEIQRSSLIGVVLNLLKIGIVDVLNFDFMDPPKPESVIAAIKQLFLLSKFF